MISSAKTALGIDISEHRISIALLKKTKKDTRLLKADDIEMPKEAIIDGNIANPALVAGAIKKRTGIETRETVLGYVQRGGSPSPMDRILATRYGAFAAQCIAEGCFGSMVAIKKNELTTVPLEEVGGKLRLVKPDLSLIKKARKMGVSFGDEYL